jgi:hypothetical protein
MIHSCNNDVIHVGTKNQPLIASMAQALHLNRDEWRIINPDAQFFLW